MDGNLLVVAALPARWQFSWTDAAFKIVLYLQTVQHWPIDLIKSEKDCSLLLLVKSSRHRKVGGQKKKKWTLLQF